MRWDARGPATIKFISRYVSPDSLRLLDESSLSRFADGRRLLEALQPVDSTSGSPAPSLALASLEILSHLEVLSREDILLIRQLKAIYGVAEAEIWMLAQIVLCHRRFPYSLRPEHLLSVSHWLEGEVGELYSQLHQTGDNAFPPNHRETLLLLKTWDEKLKEEPQKADKLKRFMESFPQILSPDREDSLLVLRDGFIISQGDGEFKNRLKQLIKSRRGLSGTEGRGEGELELSLPPNHNLNQEQAAAVRNSLSNSLTVITGGPGTGKTTTIAAIISHLVAHKTSSTASTNKVHLALVAPTGKAVNRINESLGWVKALDSLELRSATIHQLLGLSEHRDRPRYHQKNPLPYDMLILDESSMVELKLMVWLIEALPPSSKLILMGDTRQLPSIDGSAPFHEIVSLVQKAQKEQHQVPVHTHLRESHRFNPEMGWLVEAIEAGEITDIFNSNNTYAHIEVIHPKSIGTSKGLIETFKSGMGPHLNRGNEREKAAVHFPRSAISKPSESLERTFNQLSRFAFLTSSRMGFWGSRHLNAVFAHYAGRGRPYYAGQPLMVLENNYHSELFNGDRGMVLGVTGLDNGEELAAIFKGLTEEAPYRLFPLSQLPLHETSYAMTIHKSQGSEFDEVALCFTESGRLDVSKELLYTGITRAKNKLTLIATKETVSQALGHSIAPI